MASTTSAVGLPGPAALLGQLKARWGWFLALGILFIIIGFIGLGMTFALTLTSVMFFGILLLIGGCAQLVDAFKCRGWKGIVWHLLIALLYVLAGFSLVRNPVLASAMLTAMLACCLVGIGVFAWSSRLTHREASGWAALLCAGIISLALGVMILAQWPVSGLWVIGLCVAVDLIVHGASMVSLSLAVRAAQPLAA